MARVSDAEVKEIFQTTIDTSPFIVAANLIVTQNALSTDAGDILKERERWLAAHLASVRDARWTQMGVSKSAVTVDRLRYLDQVFLLDPSGKIKEALLSKPAKIRVD
jgi:mRNA-degrading endonuclease HigB of HigAB toxin-antitoxin module